MTRTYTPKISEVKRNWVIIDAADVVLGRLASHAAAILRGKDKPTNVLSFPMVQADLIESLGNTDDGEILLGDIILAAETCGREAAEKGWSVTDYAQHLIVHGLLHLLGYDHELGDTQATAMEALESAACCALGLSEPYAG